MLAVRLNWRAYRDAPAEVRQDPHVAMEALDSSSGSALEYAPEEMRSNVFAVTRAVLGDGLMLQYASDELRNDVCVAMAAMRGNPDAWRHVPPQVQKEWCVKAMHRHHCDKRTERSYVFTSKRSRSPLPLDEESKCPKRRRQGTVISSLLVVKSATDMFQYMCPEARDDRCVAMAAILGSGSLTEAGQVLAHASDAVCADPVVVTTAVHLCVRGDPLQYASDALRQERCLIALVRSESKNKKRDDMPASIHGVLRKPQMLQHATEELRNDAAVVIASVAKDGSVLQHAGEEMRNNPAIVACAVAHNGQALQYASPGLRGNASVVLVALASQSRRQNVLEPHDVLQYASRDLLCNEKFLLEAAQCNVRALEHADSALLRTPSFQSELARELGALLIVEVTMLSGSKLVRFVSEWEFGWSVGLKPDGEDLEGEEKVSWDLADFDTTAADMLRAKCQREFKLTDEQLRAMKLLCGTEPLPEEWPVVACPGVIPGRVVELQLVI